MSQPSRPQTRGPAQRRRRDFRIENVSNLEDRFLLAPFLATGPLQATFTAVTAPTNALLGNVTITPSTTTTGYPTQEPVTTVNQLTPIASFGGDIVRIEAGPGGAFGNYVYAISRGAGENAGAASRPGVIYRVDPATGKTSVFFDLNTVVTQLTPPSLDASNSVSTSSGLVNWYDLSFDPEGYFDGKPSLFIASVDRSDPNKNVVYRVAPDGSFMGLFTQFLSGQSGVKFNINPTSVLVPPVQDQSFLRGLFTGSGGSTLTANPFNALFFNANAYAPGTPITSTTLPNGVTNTNLGLGPQVGLTASNPDYASQVYSVFTDFGTPAGPGIPAQPGYSGVQGNANGELLIAPPATTTATTNLSIDDTPAVTTPFRRLEDIAFDQYGYFSQGLPLTTTTTNGVTTQTVGSPISAGSLFVADLATGLQVNLTSRAPLPVATISVPIQGPGPVGLTTDSSGNVIPIVTNGNTTGGSNIGGRILRITPDGNVTNFALGFATSGAQDSTSFINSSLSISFSADGTVLYASDDQGIWQFKTTADLADSTSGTIIGLNDLRTLGVPYDGRGAAVAIVDSGVDATSPPFRGRVAPGTNIVTGGFGNVDTSNTSATTTTAAGANTTANTILSNGLDGHGTLVAGVVAQFVPQSTLNPVNIFDPFLTMTGTTAAGGGRPGAGGAAALPFGSNATTSSTNVYNGIKYVADHPFVNDPVRPNQASRVIASTFGFGSQTTFNSEGVAFRQFSQLVIALKNQFKKYRHLGIAPIAAAGQFGNPKGDAVGTAGAGGGAAATTGATGANNAGNNNVGDSNGMSLPAVLNEVVSVTGVIPWPFVQTVNSLPTDPVVGVSNSAASQPLLISAGQTGTTGTTTNTTSPIGTLLLGNTPATATRAGGGAAATTGTFINGIPQGLYADRVLAAANRGVTTDYAAPSADIPTFRRRFSLANVTGATTTTTDPNDHLTFNQGGTSLSAGIVTGSFAMISSALNYWTNMNLTGVTSDAYLTGPVGKNTLNFGPHPFKDLSAYNNPDGINAILAWTAVPVLDPNDGLSQSQPPYLFGGTNFREIARLDIGNAIAAIEGAEATQYLIDHRTLPIIDTNNNGIITSQELQTFEDNASAMGLSEAGAMARLLGGTATTPAVAPTVQPANATQTFGSLPDQAGALQRRFNFFDYAADGQLNGSVTIAQFKMLAHTLLPFPDAMLINDRQRASANGFVLDPAAVRNFHELQHILPHYEWVPKGALTKYRNVTPAQFGIGKLKRNVDLPGMQYPVWTLFGDGGNPPNVVTNAPATQPTSTAATTSNTTAAAAVTSGNSTTTTSNPTGATTTTTGNATVATTTTSGTTGTTTTTVSSPGSNLSASNTNTTAGTTTQAQQLVAQDIAKKVTSTGA